MVSVVLCGGFLVDAFAEYSTNSFGDCWVTSSPKIMYAAIKITTSIPFDVNMIHIYEYMYMHMYTIIYIYLYTCIYIYKYYIYMPMSQD